MKRLIGLMVLGSALWGAGPRRIVSLAPTVTEILYGVGAWEQVVAVSEFCTYPEAAKRLPKAGGWHTPSLEKIVGLKPELVILNEAQAPFIEDKLKQLGIRALVTPTRTVAEVLTAIEQIGAATGRAEAGRRLAASTRAQLEGVRKRAGGRKVVSVVVVVDRSPGTLRDLYLATGESFLAELVEMAGGRVMAPAVRAAYVKISKETLLQWNPDYVLDLAHGSRGKSAEELLAPWRQMPELKAVGAGRVIEVREDAVPHASQRMVETAELFLQIFGGQR